MTNIARLIDQSLLKPDASESEIIRLCEEAGEFGFHAVCVNPYFIKTARELLFKTHVKVAAVIGFPLGMTISRVKIYEAIEAVLAGADELDIVMNIGLAKSGKWEAVEKEITDIITATPGVIHKIIIETCYLTDNEKKKACLAIRNAGAEFIKTSTGFGPSGATLKDVKLIKSITKNTMGLKAAGGISTIEDVKVFIEAGATRIGTSSGVKIIESIQK